MEKFKNQETQIDEQESEELNLGNFERLYEKLNLETPIHAKEIIDIFEKSNETILIPGGFARDLLLNQIPRDIDFATNLRYEKVEELLKNNNLEIKKIEPQGKTFQVLRVIFNNGEEYEIATFRKDGNYSDGIHPDEVIITNNPKEDALRRDFTMNALFYNPINGDVIDYINGVKDIKEKRLEFVGDPNKRIEEDKSRIIRYVRFLLQTGFEGDKESELAILNHAKEINIVPRELLKKELDKIFAKDNPKKIIELFDKLNLLEEILPEINDLKNCEQGAPYHMEGNAFVHTMLACENLSDNADPILKWATLFHDIGKPCTKKAEIKNDVEKVSFINHEKVGAEMTSHILKKLKFSHYERRQIHWLIENHLKIFMQIFSFIENNTETAQEKSVKAMKKMIKSCGEEQMLRLINLGLADSTATIPENKKNQKDYFDQIFHYFELAKEEIKKDNEKGVSLEKIINGKFIMEKLGLKQGPEIGKIKDEIIEELSDQNFSDKEDLEKRFLETLDKFKK